MLLMTIGVGGMILDGSLDCLILSPGAGQQSPGIGISHLAGIGAIGKPSGGRDIGPIEADNSAVDLLSPLRNGVLSERKIRGVTLRPRNSSEQKNENGISDQPQPLHRSLPQMGLPVTDNDSVAGTCDPP